MGLPGERRVAHSSASQPVARGEERRGLESCSCGRALERAGRVWRGRQRKEGGATANRQRDPGVGSFTTLSRLLANTENDGGGCACNRRGCLLLLHPIRPSLGSGGGGGLLLSREFAPPTVHLSQRRVLWASRNPRALACLGLHRSSLATDSVESFHSFLFRARYASNLLTFQKQKKRMLTHVE